MSDTTRPKPPWLGPTPFNSFVQYSGHTRELWNNKAFKAWSAVLNKRECLHDTHKAALEGDPVSLELMRQFYINLTTERLKS